MFNPLGIFDNRIIKLNKKINKHLENNATLNLNSEIIGVRKLDALLEQVFAKSSIVIEAASITFQEKLLSITGQTNLFSANLIPITVEIRDVDNILRIKILLEHVQILLADINPSLLNGSFPIPKRLQAFKLKSIKLPISDDPVLITTELTESLDLGGGNLIINTPTKFVIEASNLLEASRSAKGYLKANLSLLDKKAELTGTFTIGEEGDASFQIEPSPPSLGDLIEQMIGVNIPLIKELDISELRLSKFLNKDSFELSGNVMNSWSLPLGSKGLKVEDTNVTVIWENENLSGTIFGRILVAGEEIDVQSNLIGDLIMTGDLPSVKLLSLVDEVLGSSLSIPSGFPDITLPESKIQIQTLADSAKFLLQATVNKLGIVHLLIDHIANQWEAALVFVLPKDWKFSDLSNILSPLDQLKITAPTLTLASFNEPNLKLPVINGEELQLAIEKGLNLSTNLSLESLGLDLVSEITNMQQLPLQLTVGDNFADTTVRASFERIIEVVPDVIILDNIGIEIQPDPFELSFVSSALVSVAGEKLPEFKVSNKIDDNSTRLVYETAEVWNEPFGISNLIINQLVFQMETSPVPKYAVLGAIIISNKTIKIVVELRGNFPSMIYGECRETLSLAEVTSELVGLKLPTGLIDITISDFMIRAVGDPSGVRIGDELFEPGLALQGKLGFFDLETLVVKVIVDPGSGVFAHGSLSNKVEIGPLLTISNASGDGPPTATLDTRNTSLLKISGRYELLGLIGQGIDGLIDHNGMAFEIDGKVLIVQYAFFCQVKSLNNFTAEGAFDFAIKETIGPIEIKKGWPSLGKIVLDVGFEGTISLSWSGEQFKALINGGFQLQGLKVTIELSLDELSSLEEIPQKIIDQIKKDAAKIFAELLNDSEKWLLAIRDKIIREVENVAKVLRDFYQRDAAYIGKSIRDTLDRGSKEAAEGLKSIGETPETIAKVLKDLGDTPNTIAGVLKELGESPKVISSALQAVDERLVRVEKLLSDIGFPDAEIADSLREVFGDEAVNAVNRAREAAAAEEKRIREAAEKKAREAREAAAAEEKRIREAAEKKASELETKVRKILGRW